MGIDLCSNNLTFINLNLNVLRNMSSSKILCSLPKTQPTLSSSSNSHLKSNHRNQILNISHQPLVSAFISDQKEEKYIHKMKIDYGKLSRPFHEKVQTCIKKEVDLSVDLGLLLSTRKFKNLKQYTLNDTEREGIEPPIHSLLTQKKAFSTNRVMQFQTPNSENKIQQNKQKKRNRIMSVKAYEKINISGFSDSKNVNPTTDRKVDFNDQMLNHFQKITINKSRFREQEAEEQRTDRSDRKISHSRIIKTFNPTAGIQTKIITYPDQIGMTKLRESRKKMILTQKN